MRGAASGLVRHWVVQAARAPSPHNCQPARWCLREEQLELWEDTARWLAVGDRSGRDNTLALGMAWEGLQLAASRDGYLLDAPILDEASYPPVPGPRRRARARLHWGGIVDPLAAMQSDRHTCRRSFRPATQSERERLLACLAEHHAIAQPVDGAHIAGVATAQQGASIALLRDRAMGVELYDWLRLSAGHPQVHRDGLDAACLELNALEAWGANWLMRPALAAFLAASGLGGLLVEERAKVLSATAIVVLAADAEIDDFHAGRLWYRFWLQLTAAGFVAVPMSALVDTNVGRAALERLHLLGAGQRYLNVMRIGPSPSASLPRSARLPVDELIIAADDTEQDYFALTGA